MVLVEEHVHLVDLIGCVRERLASESETKSPLHPLIARPGEPLQIAKDVASHYDMKTH